MKRSYVTHRLVPLALIVALVGGCGGAASDRESATDEASSATAAPTEPGSMGSDETSATESVAGEADEAKAAQQSDDAERQVDEPTTSSAAQEEYDYPDEPEPAAGVVATLCNLDPGYLGSLRNENSSGDPVVDDDLRLAVVALGDQISYWETLRDDYPDAADDIESADKVLDLWEQAVVSSDNGESSAAQGALAEADDVISSLSGEAAPGSAECVG